MLGPGESLALLFVAGNVVDGSQKTFGPLGTKDPDVPPMPHMMAETTSPVVVPDKLRVMLSPSNELP